MAIDESFVNTVAFVGTIVPERRLVGTAFYVAVSSERYPGAEHLYVATAAHVARPISDSSFVRVRRLDGGVDDIRIEEWHFHPSADVAVANIEIDQAQHEVVVVPQKMFADASEYKPTLGEEVYFIGLLGQVEAMGAAAVPMVRTGTLGAIDQPDVPMAEPDGTPRRVRGHLIDCRSFGGFSGSPCFMKLNRLTGVTERLGLRYPETYPILLGILGGHFDHRTSLRLPDDQTVSAPASAGIGVVYPVDVLREVLEINDLLEERAQAQPPPESPDNSGTYGDAPAADC